MKIILILVVLSMNAWSQHNHDHDQPMGIDCVPVQKNSIHKLLEWWGADDKQIQNAPCKTKNPPTESEIDQFIAGRAKGSDNETVHGVKFKNESPLLIKAFKELTTAKDPYGISENKELQKKLQTEYNINPTCEKVICAMEKIWGKDLAKKVMYVKLKHNFNTSELAFQNSDRFTAEELDDVIIGLEDLPGHLVPLGASNQRLTHFKRGYTLAQYSDGLTVANAVVMLFDLWDQKPRATRQYTIFHELAHNVSTKLKDMDESPDWLKLSGWVKKGADWESKSGSCFISKYGQSNPWEDYAESLSSYRYNAPNFKKTCPEKYAFLKSKVFKDVEYTDLSTCSPISPEKTGIAHKAIIDHVISTIGNVNFSEDEIKDGCKGGFNNYPLTADEISLCSMKLHTDKILANSSEKISEALKLAGIADTASNRDQIIAGIKDTLSQDATLSEAIAQKSGKVEEGLNSIVEKSFTDANPEGFSKKGITADDYRWRTTLKACGSSMFENKVEETVHCQIKQMMKEDKDMQKWDIGAFPAYKFPPIFNSNSVPESLLAKRDDVLFNHLVKHEVTAQAIAKEKEDFKEHLKYHHLSITNKLDTNKDWKKMTPQDFCRSTYGSGSSWTETYGYNSEKTLPKLYESCVELQSKKSRRFEIKQSDWNSMIDKLQP